MFSFRWRVLLEKQYFVQPPKKEKNSKKHYLYPSHFNREATHPQSVESSWFQPYNMYINKLDDENITKREREEYVERMNWRALLMTESFM